MEHFYTWTFIAVIFICEFVFYDVTQEIIDDLWGIMLVAVGLFNLACPIIIYREFYKWYKEIKRKKS